MLVLMMRSIRGKFGDRSVILANIGDQSVIARLIFSTGQAFFSAGQVIFCNVGDQKAIKTELQKLEHWLTLLIPQLITLFKLCLDRAILDLSLRP